MTPCDHPHEYRPAGTRNFVRVGDVVRVRPPIGQSLTGRVTRLDADPATGAVVAVHYLVVGGPDSQVGKSRVTTPDHVARKDQKRNAALREVRYGAPPTTRRRGGR